ncbi:hypothetical protein HMPREF0262_03434 [Clostridium sp. ATCC 29733]|nr:hypothetical protein HMPREF0262_03434 [Clostridium sp. ATCC 29733]
MGGPVGWRSLSNRERRPERAAFFAPLPEKKRPLFPKGALLPPPSPQRAIFPHARCDRISTRRPSILNVPKRTDTPPPYVYAPGEGKMRKPGRNWP